MTLSFPGFMRSALLTTFVAAGAASAQERLPDGRLLTFSTTFGLQASDNPDLDENGRSRTDALTRFRLGMIDATENKRFEAFAGFGIEASAGGRDDDTVEFIDPDLALSYVLQSRASVLSLGASIRRSEVSSLSPLELVLDDTLTEQELEDFLNGDIPGDTQRLTFRLTSTLETRRDTPFGVTYSLGVSGVRYDGDTGSPDDETRFSSGMGLRFDLSETLRATADLDYTTYDEDRDDSTGLNLAITQRFALSSLGARLGFVSDSTGLRSSLAMTGALERRFGALSGEIGVSRTEDGELGLITSASANVDLPTGGLTFNLSRNLVQLEDLDDRQRLRTVTTISTAYTRQMTRAWRLGLDTRQVWATLPDGDESESFGQVGIDLSRSLTRDWALTVGANHRFETDASDADVSGSTLSLSLTRAVRLPF